MATTATDGVGERRAAGRAARRTVPRRAHRAFAAAPDRADPVELLESQAADRIPELVPIRYGRMLASPFAFFRGAALLMASDLAAVPATGLRVQLCGDAHLSNFGVFGTPERRLVFDINDFDETLPGPFEWDVKRLAASLAVAGRGNGFATATRAGIVRAAAARYRTAMAGFAAMGNLDVFSTTPDVDQMIASFRRDLRKDPLAARMQRNTDRLIAKARRRDRMSALERFAERGEDGGWRIASDPPLVLPIRDLLEPEEAEAFVAWAHGLLREYRRTLLTDRRRLAASYRLVDAARKVVGVGSVGTGAWIALLLGRDDADPLFLQFKEAPPSVLERFLGRSEYRNGGHRVVAGQRLMQAVGDAFLGWISTTGPDGRKHDYYVRQLRDWKGSAVVEDMVPPGMRAYGEMCGWTLARAHARSGDRIAIASYLGRGTAFDEAMAEFAEAYADQNEQDHAALQAAADSGRIAATTGV